MIDGTATALELFRSKRLDCDTPVGEFVPELGRSRKARLIQIKHLISQTVGYMGFADMPPTHVFPDRAFALAALRKSPQLFEPGLVFNYEHSATAMLGEILESVSGTPVPRLINDIVFLPLGIHDLRKQSNLETRSRADSLSLLKTALTIPDLLLFVESLMSDQRGHSRVKILSADTLGALRKPVVTIPRAPGTSAARLLATGSGLGLQTYKAGTFGYEGQTGKQAVGFRFDPLRQLAIVLGIDRSSQHLRRIVLGGILDLLDELPHSSTPEVPDESDPGVLTIADVVGSYVGNNSFYVTVRKDGDNFVVQSHSKSGSTKGIRGQLQQNGRPVFKNSLAGAEPTFFRYARTGELCMMFGNFALKQRRSEFASFGEFVDWSASPRGRAMC